MSEEPNMKQGNDVPASITLAIEFTKEGKINVNGPITNEMLCYFLLEKAKDIIKGHNLKLAIEERQRVMPAKGGIMNFARRRF